MKRTGAHLGQHFLRDRGVVVRMMDAAGVDNSTLVLEVGPGKGVLTKELLARGARVIAVEKDSTLVAELRETFTGEIAAEQLVLIEEDIRNIDPASLMNRFRSSGRAAAGSYVVCANIPYYITGEIIRQFLTATKQPEKMALLIQKEVAERIVAGDKKESILSLSVKVFGTPKKMANVPRGAFAPPPAVDSAVLLIEGISRSAFMDREGEDHFFQIVKAGFANKRKMLAGNLSVLADKKAVVSALSACGIEQSARAEDVPLSKWLELSKRLRPSSQ